MKRKEILEFIRDNNGSSFGQICTAFDCTAKGGKKQLARILADFEQEGLLTYEAEGDRFVPSARQKKNMIKIIKPGVEPKSKPTEKNRVRIERKKGSPAVEDYTTVIEEYKIRNEFPPNTLKEAEEIPETIPEAEKAGRMDLRNRIVVTIDGADAKDLDDAVSIEVKEGGWELGVHIADVSYYVPKESKLDREALKRANSFYFINKVIPMFPKNLSNGICSLNPNDDRLTLSVFMDIDAEGNVGKYRLAETIIHSRNRLTYDRVQAYLDGKEPFADPEVAKTLDEMNQLFRVLNKKRLEGGSIDFDFKEQKCVLDEDDEPVKIYLKDRQDSERLIEEFMLVANQTVAKFLSEKGVSLYRIHGEPDPERIQDFVRIALKFGHKIYGVPVPEPRELQRIMEEIRDKPHKELISQVLLRSMQQAKYDTDNIGHFGLGFEFYTHFTSPIRRYADLIVHRLIRHILTQKRQKPLYTQEELEEIAVHISKVERVAMEAERDLYKMKAIRFMKDRVGKEFAGMITGVSSFGIFVQIKIFGVEGLVRYQDMDDDYYEYDEKNFSAVGKRRKKRYMMGDQVQVRVKKVNIERRFLDLIILDTEVPFSL